MKNIYKFIAPLCLAVLTFMSCIKDNEVATSPECAIIDFKVGDIKSYVDFKKSDGTDTTISRTILGNDIKFNIDQINGNIFTVDSLPKWVDIKKVVPKFTAYGNVFAQVNMSKGDSLFYYVTSGTDSIDFTKPVNFVVIATDGYSSKSYTVDIRKSNSNTDTLEWKGITSNKSFGMSNHAVALNGVVYMFYDNLGKTGVATTTDGAVWTSKGVAPVDLNSVLTFHGKMYGLGLEDGCIYASADAETWNKTSDKVLKQILAADSLNFYAFDGTNIIGTADFADWTNCGSADIDYLPTSCFSTACYKSKTNSNMQFVMMFGLNDSHKDNSIAWYKTTSKDDNINQDWAYVNVTSDNDYPFLYLEDLSVARYNDSFFAIGTEDGEYKELYNSADNGISWHKQTSVCVLPAGINEQTGKANILTVGNELWIIRDSRVWRGAIR